MSGAAPVIPDYTLLRPIGRGAYGEVWLVRSVTGIYRAAKIIHRDRFEDARPFEREFAGIQRVEPVSRAGEHQLTIHHVGRNEAAGYFYCVMELADDVRSGSDIVPETYVPKTLREMSERQQRLPAAECLAIAVALTRALSQLHRHGLVHRDIKPSNVIFVHGVPKLADIGLVSTVDESASFVGTEGFVPPEGPGSIQADLYSLGKVIYEISTGRDRTEFPQLPVDLENLPDKRALLELNEVTLKACDPASHRRYASAQAMHDDLLLLQAGKSIRRLHAIERRFRLAAKYGIAATALMLAAGGAFLWASYQARKARENFALSERHRFAAEHALWESELNQARARRLTGVAGRRFETLDLFRRLAAGSNRLDLRNEAIASLKLHDLRLLRQWRQPMPQPAWTFLPELRRYLTNDAAGNIVVRSVETDEALALLPGAGAPLVATFPSNNGEMIATCDRENEARIWHLKTQDAISIILPPRAKLAGFTSHDDALIVRHADGSLHFLDATTGVEKTSWHGPFSYSHISFNSAGTLFFTVTGADVVIRDATNGKSIGSLSHPEAVATAVWHPDGRRLAAACGTTIHLWNTSARQRIAVAEEHDSRVVGLSFDGTGDFLVSCAWDHTTRLWETETLRELVRSARGGNGIRVSSDGRRLAFTSWNSTTAELWEIAGSSEARRFSLPDAPRRIYRQTYHGGFSPDGRLVHLNSSDAVFFFSARSLHSVASIRDPFGVHGLFGPSAKQFITGGRSEIRLWPIGADIIDGALPVGPPVVAGGVTGTIKSWTLSPDGELLVAATADGFSLLNLNQSGDIRHSEPRIGFDGEPGMSADGRWVAIGSRTQGVQLWETLTGRAVTNLPVSGRATCTFSPDNRWLVTATKHEYRFWEVSSWKPGIRFERSPFAGAWPSMAFTPDGKVVALCVPPIAVRLLHTGTDREIATLPTARLITDVCFSPQGDRLLVIYEPGTAELWDLQRIHEGLAALNLEWEEFVPAKKQPIDSGGQRSRSFPPPAPTAFLAPIR